MYTNKTGDIRVTAGFMGDRLQVTAEAAPAPYMTYDSVETLEHAHTETTHAETEKEPGAIGVMDSLKPVLAKVITVLVLVIIILIIYVWQKKKNTGRLA